MSLIAIVKNNKHLKQIAHWMMIPNNDFRPRLWLRLLINPFVHKRSYSAIIRFNTRMDLLPFNNFSIGSKSVIESFSTINNGVGDVKIGDRTIIGLSNTIIGPVEIGDDVMLAQHIVVSGLNHGYEDVTVPPSKQPVHTSKITIGDHVWIGANSLIVAGVTIGRHAVVGGGSVVTKDVEEYTVVVGNPARVVKRYNFESKVWERV